MLAVSHARLNTDQLFEGLTAQERVILNDSGVTHRYKKGEIIFREGGIPAGIFYIIYGKAKKYRATAKGGEQIIFLCGEGEVLGYHALLADEYYYDSATTIETSLITFIPKETFLKILHGSATLSNLLLKTLGHEFSLYITGLTNLATKTVRERLAFNLLLLETKFTLPNKSEDQIEINISRTDLANMVGTAKETVVRLLRDFKNKGLIAANGKGILIRNRKGLLSETNIPLHA